MSSPVPSPVPAGTERVVSLTTAIERVMEAHLVDCEFHGDDWHEECEGCDYWGPAARIFSGHLAAVVSSSPATPERCREDSLCTLPDGNHDMHYDARDGASWPNIAYQWAAPSPATPEGERPASMLEPVSLGDPDPNPDLKPVRLEPINEAEDEWDGVLPPPSKVGAHFYRGSLVRCHCGEPAVRSEADEDGRMDDFCDRCTEVRCDAYPGACNPAAPAPASPAETREGRAWAWDEGYAAALDFMRRGQSYHHWSGIHAGPPAQPTNPYTVSPAVSLPGEQPGGDER